MCAPFTREINLVASVLGYKPDMRVLDPHDLDDILTSIMDVAERVGKIKEGRKLVVSLRYPIDAVKIRAGHQIQ